MFRRLGTAVGRDDEQLAGERAVDPRKDDQLAVWRPVVIEDLRIANQYLLVAAVRLHRPELARADEGDAIALRAEGRADLGFRRVGQALHLELVGLGQFGMLGVVRLEQVEVFVAGAVGEEEDALAVRAERRRVIEGGRIGEARGLAAAGKRNQEQLALDRDDRGSSSA